MVVSRSDIKRRQKDGEGGLPESPKRTKVHAQRKFAQGSNMNTPALTPVKEKDKGKANGTVAPKELLPAKRPNTEDFLTFLCFRGTQKLPSKLDFFNVAATPEQQDDDSKADHGVAGSSRVSARCIEKSFSEQSFTVAKAETKTRNKPRPTAAVQAFKKKYQEQRLAKQKISLTKLAQKVKGKNMVRTRSAALLEENRRATKTVPQRSFTVAPPVKAKTAQKSPIKSSVKRLIPKQINNSLRGGLRSGGELPPGSDIGLKSERKPRPIVKERERPSPKTSKRYKAQPSKVIASSLSDFSSDDDQPLVKKQRINLRRQRFQFNTSITTRSNHLERLRRNRNEMSKNRITIRPTRKTKEAAALFMEEMIGKDLRNPDEDSDYNDETFSDKSFTETASKKTERKEKEAKSTSEKSNVNKALPKDNTKRDNSDPEIFSAKKKKDEDKKLLKKTVVKLNMMKEKDSKSIKKLPPNKGNENKPSTPKTVRENKLIELPNKFKSEIKGKTFSNRSDRRHSLPEEPKIMVVKRSTRQRPGNLSLDSSPARLKIELNEIDDKFSDSDEEPLGNISGKKATTSKQVIAKKSTADTNLVPILRKEMGPASKVSVKKNEVKKIEGVKKLTEKQRNEDLKNKTSPKKDNLRKCFSEEVINIEEKLESNSRNEMKSKCQNIKSAEDLYPEVKLSSINKGNTKSRFLETKDLKVKKTETACNKSGNVKIEVEMSTENAQKPKLKKGWAFCNDTEDSTSNGSLCHRRDAKTTSANKIVTDTDSKKETDQKPLAADKTLKTSEVELVLEVSETSSKKVNKQNKSNISGKSLCPENNSIDKGSQKNNAKLSVELNTSKNKTKQTNKKSNITNTIENTSLADNTSKMVLLQNNSKGSTNSVRSSSGKNKKNNLENPLISDSPSVNVKSLNESARKNTKSKVSISGFEKQDTFSHNKKNNKNVDSEIVWDSGKSSSKSNVKNCLTEVKQIDSPVCYEAPVKDNSCNNNQDSSPLIHKSITNIGDSNCKTNLNEEINEDCSNTDFKSNKNVFKKTNKTSINKAFNTDNKEINTSKNKKSAQKVDDKMEPVSDSIKEDTNDKNQEKVEFSSLANETRSNDNLSEKSKRNSNKPIVKVPDSNKCNAKNKEKALFTTEITQLPNTEDLSKTCSELDKNKSVINADKNICTKTIDESCTKNTVVSDKSRSSKKCNKIKDEEMVNFIAQVENVKDDAMSVIRQDTNTQITSNTNTMVGNNNNFEIGSLKETRTIVTKIVTSQSVQKEQPSGSSKFIPSIIFNKCVENHHSSIPQTPKSNTEFTDFKNKDQEQLSVSKNVEQLENNPDTFSMQPQYINLNRMPQQRQVAAQKSDQLNPSRTSKPDNVPNDRCLFKEGIKPNTETRIPENIDSKDKVLNLDQPKSVKNSPKMDEKLKNETFFGNTKEMKNNMSESKLKVDMPLPGFQLLKSSTKAKSMLKPGTLIDIAGGLNVGLQSDSLTNFMRPPLDNAMTKAIKTDNFPPDNSSVQSSAAVVTAKVEVKSEPFSFSPSKSIKDDLSNSEMTSTVRKEKVDTSSKNKTSVNDTWRQAFKNVKIPKPGTSNNSTNADKPVVRKPLSVTALAKKHTLAKSDTTSSDKAVSQPSIPFLRQSKLFLGGGNQSQTNSSKLSAENSKIKTNTEIDMNKLRKKEAEVEEIVRRYYAGEFSKSPSDVGSVSVSNKPPTIQTEINVSSSSNLNISHQREDYVSRHKSFSSIADIKRNNSPVINISQLKEDKQGRNNETTRTNSPFTVQQTRDGNDILEVNSPVLVSIQPKEDISSTFSGSVFSGKDRTPSPSSLSRSYTGNVDEHSPRHIPIPSLPMFSKSVHSNSNPSFSEAKHHHLPLPVEQTLKKLSLTKLSTNKKVIPVGNSQPKLQEIKDIAIPIVKSEETIMPLPKSGSEPNTKYNDQITPSFDFNRASTHCINNDISPLNVDLMAKKKVNMTTEEITKWLSDSTSVGIEHKQNCGIFDKNHCECGYKTLPSTPSSQNIQEIQAHHSIREEVNLLKMADVEPVKTESQNVLNNAIKNDDVTLKPCIKEEEIIETNNTNYINKKDVSVDVNNSTNLLKNVADLENSNSLFLTNKSEGLNVVSISGTNFNEQLSTVDSASNVVSLKGCVKTLYSEKLKDCDDVKSDLKSKDKTLKPLKLTEMTAKNNKNLDNELFESNMDIPTSPTTTRPKVGRQTNHRPGDSEAELSSRDPSEVSSPPPRDDVSSSNDDSPDKFVHPERRSIFHQRRSVMKVKERKEALLSPSTSAFSPDNESSVYAFDPDLPPTSSTPPFRRCKKDGRTSGTATDDDESTPSSASIAVQVNLDNEAVLECSTQTEMQEADDDDGSEGHLFYIPLQQSHADVATTQQLIQGVAVKLGTEGPDQRVIMRAKLVTKPPSTFNRQPSSSAARALMPNQISRSGKPEQKVRPLSVKSPPVGTVTPTTRAGPSRTNVQPAVSIQTSPRPDHFEVDDKNNIPGPSKTISVEPEVKPNKTKSPDRIVHAPGKTTKRGKGRQSQITTASVCSEFPAATDPAKLVEAPTFYPNDKEFQDPLEYIDSIRPLAEKFGLCRVVPPSDFKPECKVSDDMRFTAYNQYIHKMLHRWGPNVKEMMAIRKYLATQSIALTHPPWVGGMEVDLPRLYQTVQVCGGLKEVIEKKRWNRVADTMKIPKSAQDRVTKLDDIYCKFLLPYDTLSHEERTKLFKEVESDWEEREKRVNNATDSDSEDSDTDDIDECIVKGRSMALNAFYRIARNTMSMWFSKTEQPGASEVEAEFWRHVNSRQCHVCVHSGSIDSGSVGYGFPVAKNSSTSRHPWNLKVLTNNPGSILRSLGPLMGVTVPTLHVGMLFSACCWYRDPHGLPWIEYLHTGASKIWYGIPDSSSSVFRDAATKLVPRLCRDKTIWLASDTAMVPPPLLVERGVSLCRVVQEPGQFIIVFPKAFTSSICTGYLVSESVYFAQPSWLASAQQIFDDIRESCEPCMFSLEKLLFSIAIDTRTSVDVLNQILPMMLNIQDEEIARRKQLEELGLSNSERLPVNKRRRTRPTNDEEADYECDICRANLFLSLVTNTHEESVYCLSHAIDLLSKKRSQLKHCNFIYTYSEDELIELVDKLKSRIETKSQKKLQGKNVQANKN